jgi:ATP-dependent RNA helicase DeaD
MITFSDLGLSPDVLKGIEALGFASPTPIQEKVIPVVLGSDRDVIGLAQTGTGKTAAFGLPVIERCDPSKKFVQAVVLSPTRELCIQIAGDLRNFSKFIPSLKIATVYGGASILVQINELKQGAHIIVATPGRLLDLLKRKAAHIDAVSTVILDEADEMLNMGFKDDLDSILSRVPVERRTLLFSATMSEEVRRISREYLTNPQEVTVGHQNAGAENIRHLYYLVHAKDRYAALKRVADVNPDIYGMVFCRTRMETKEIADKLIKDGYNADAIHGDLSQAQREFVMKRFRERNIQMLVATDVAARGIDVNDITHVINYNLPEEIEVYTHRSGRTGRAGKTGVAISLVNYREKNRIPEIERMLRRKVERVSVPGGEEICRKQLFHLIDKMENVALDEEQIAPFMDSVNKKLEWLSKEEVIKRFVSLEFNRFLQYYKDAPDLNDISHRDAGFSSGEPGGRRGKKGRSERPSDRFEDNRGRSRTKDIKYQRFFMNLGRKDGINPSNIIGIINDNAKDRDIRIGAIEVKDSFSFFEVEDRFAGKVMDSVNDIPYRGRLVQIDYASDQGPGAAAKKKKPKKKY